ncbi:HAD-IB family hydrolase [Photobacterium sanctipauli]|uniref:HAD-IB family hydrolase n=1 Tax=Photobacterium sanctipauli TaxID=1342794 RepID=A0A2T3NU92_9GAMM|nr:HAD family hydrolase [Photobacterium sanctipauli]PSW19860.1 HAD-IB family hydrolase [Photobacterium sanctipauli]
MKKYLIIFDMDETLVSSDCSTLWHKYLVEKDIANEPGFLEKDKALMQAYYEGNMSLNEYFSFSVEPLAQLSERELTLHIEDFIEEKVLANVYPQAQALIHRLNSLGHTTMVISASASFLVEPIARRLGLHEAMGVDLKRSLSGITGEVEGIASYQMGKVLRLKLWLEHKGPFDKITFFSDSHNDLPLLEYAACAVAVNPDSKLEHIARESGWNICEWSVASSLSVSQQHAKSLISMIENS